MTTLLRMAAQAESRLVAISFRPAMFVEAGIAWKEGAYVSRAARAFVEFVLDADLPGSDGVRSVQRRATKTTEARGA